jgi:hypothetical protein
MPTLPSRGRHKGYALAPPLMSNVRPQMIIRLAFAAVLFAVVVPGWAATTDDEAISSYFLPPRRLENQFRASVPALIRQHPELKDDLQYVAAHFDGAVASARSAALLTPVLSDGDRKFILAFVPTPAGKALGQIQEEQLDPQRQMEAIARLPSVLRKPLDQFIVSVPVQKVLRTLYSEEATRVNQAYGKELRCKYIQMISPVEHSELVKLGHCPRSGGVR